MDQGDEQEVSEPEEEMHEEDSINNMNASGDGQDGLVEDEQSEVVTSKKGGKKSFRCTTCNYVTNVKARFTKHVRYHSMPMIKCDYCDFKTPYRWNLDRHYKSHNGDGSLCCPLCNFSCDIKQSLTVHVQNHHTEVPENIGELVKQALLQGEKANIPYMVSRLESPSNSMAKKSPALKRRNSSSPARSTVTRSFVGGAEKRFKTEPSEHSEKAVDQRSKCPYCNYRTVYENNLQRHIGTVHSRSRPAVRRKSFPCIGSKQMPNLIPIPIQPRTRTKACAPQQKTSIEIQSSPSRLTDSVEQSSSIRTPDHETLTIKPDDLETKIAFLKNFDLKPTDDCITRYSESKSDEYNKVDSIPLQNTEQENTSQQSDESDQKRLSAQIASTITPRGRRTSFFEKLTKKLVANSKSDDISPQGFSMNSITITSNSTRCQYCRQRCKTSIALVSHLGQCPVAKKHLEENNDDEDQPDSNINGDLSGGKKVFVWNTSPRSSNSAEDEEYEMRLRKSTSSDREDLVGYETSPGIGLINRKKNETAAGDGNDSSSVKSTDSVIKSRKVYKCDQPNCEFWATTASRFHVHVVGHNNVKPFECSQCSYRSNWKWDISKHIRLKTIRDSSHANAKVLMINESGERNYRKYDTYLVDMELKYSADSKLPDCSTVASKRSDVELNPPSLEASPLSSPSSLPHHDNNGTRRFKMPKLTKAPASASISGDSEVVGNVSPGLAGPPPILTPMSGSPPRSSRTFVQTRMLSGGSMLQNMVSKQSSTKPVTARMPNLTQALNPKQKKPLWKCKRCTFRHPNKDVVIIHIRHVHKPKMGEPVSILNQNNLTDVNYDQDIDEKVNQQQTEYNIQYAAGLLKCELCPFLTSTPNLMEDHMGLHSAFGKQLSTFTCTYCSTSFASRRELLQHMKVHGSGHLSEDKLARNVEGVITAEEMRQKPRGSFSPGGSPQKKYHCLECPYVTDSKAQFLYHKQFHTPRDALYQCSRCSYSVSHKHLLHQHIRVHSSETSVRGKDDFTNDEPNENHNTESDTEDLQESISIEAETNDQSHPTVLVWKNGRAFRMFRCRLCPQVFGKLNDLTQHEEGHTQESNSAPCEAVNLSMNYRDNAAAKMNSPLLKANTSSFGRTMHSPSIGFPPQQQKMVLYMCDECPARFFYEREIRIHHSFHKHNCEFKCHLCSYTARLQVPNLMSHMKVHGREYQNQTQNLLMTYSRAAPIDFDSKSNYPSPITIIPSNDSRSSSTFNSKWSDFTKPDASINCKICPAKFNTMASFIQHSNNHGSLARYRCRHCDYGTDSSNNLTLHEILHSGSEITIEPEPVLPVVRHRPQTPIIPVIPLPISTATEPIQNQKRKIDDEFGEEAYIGNPNFVYPTYVKNGKVKSKRYKCNTCPSAFEKRDQFKVHIGLHGADKRYKCTVCNYAVTNYANYIQHLKIHENQEGVPPELLIVKPLSKRRGEDGKSPTATSSGRQNEISFSSIVGKVSKGRAMKCGRCPFSTAEKESFQEHRMHHTLENPGKTRISDVHKCSFCDFAVPKKNLLIDHVRLHFQINDQVEISPRTSANKIVPNVEIFEVGNEKEALYSEKENYDEHGSNDPASVKSQPITLIDLKQGLPLPLLDWMNSK